MFYRWEDSIGLYPVPNKPAILERVFPHQRPEHYVPIVEIGDGGSTYFNDRLSMNLDDDTEDPIYRIFISHASVYLRRSGLNMPGELTLLIQDPLESPQGSDYYYQRYSQPIPASLIGPIGNWYHFDFSHNPIKVEAGQPKEFVLSITVDPAYLATDSETYGERIELGVDKQYDSFADVTRNVGKQIILFINCLLYTSPSPRD